MSTPVYIFDIDGTLADCSHRLHHIQKAPKDWSSFFAGCIYDGPIPHMIALLNKLMSTTHIILVSGRSDECREDTLTWLGCEIDGVDFSESLYMRKAGDHRDDDIVKIELLAQIRADGFEPIMAFDDRTRVVRAWRAAGIPCCQCAPGDF